MKSGLIQPLITTEHQLREVQILVSNKYENILQSIKPKTMYYYFLRIWIVIGYMDFVDGVMIGRYAYKNPWLMSGFDELFYDQDEIVKSKYTVAKEYLEYSLKSYEEGVPLYRTMRHLMGLFQGIRGGKKLRRYISENLSNPDFHKFMKKDILNFIN